MNGVVFEFVQAWFLFPIVLITTSVCLGIAVFKFSKLELKSALVLPAGFVSLVFLGELLTLNGRSSTLAPFIVLAVTLFCVLQFWGVVTIWFRLNFKNLALGLAVFYLHGLPILMSGTPTFAGWIKLDDGSTWLAIADQMLSAGRDTSNVTPSSYEAINQILLNPTGGGVPYPTGAFVNLGIFAKWLVIDPAWILQPYMAAAAMLLCISFTALLRPLQIPVWSKSLSAFVAPMSALYIGYEMWGGVKELLLVPILVFVTAMIPVVLEDTKESRRVIPFTLGCAAYISIFGPSGAVWLVVPVIFLGVLVSRRSNSIPWKHVSIFIGVFCVASLSTLIPVLRNPNVLSGQLSFAQSSSDIGNLLGPLKFSQIFGIWMTGDFRYPPEFPFVNTVLIVIAALLFIVGCYCLFFNGHSHIALLAIWVMSLSAVTLRGNAWISGKTLAMASPIILVVIFCAVGYISTKFKVEAGILALVLSGGVLCSYVYTFHEVWLAPYDQLKELENIGKNSDLMSPALMLEYSPYGARHFLRQLDAEGASEVRRNVIPLKDGKGLDKAAFADIDEFSLDAIESYETLVLRTSANSSRPPANYELQSRGEYYEVWQKNPNLEIPVQHYSFGSTGMPTAVPECSFIESTLIPQLTGNKILVSSGQLFSKLQITEVTDLKATANASKTYESKFELSNSSQYDLWVEGWIKGRAKIFIDDKLIKVPSHILNQSGNMAKVVSVQIEAGPHTLKIITDSPWITPGSGGRTYPMGPFYLSDLASEVTVEEVKSEDLKSLCSKSVDWIALVPN